MVMLDSWADKQPEPPPKRPLDLLGCFTSDPVTYIPLLLLWVSSSDVRAETDETESHLECM